MSHRLHGTHVKYVIDRCRCDECRQANSEYERERASRTAPTLVSATPAREHIKFLQSQGVGYKTVGERAGISHGAMSKLVFGDPRNGRPPSRRCRPETLARILAVSPADAADGAPVDAGPSWVILDRLIAAGVPRTEISRRLGNSGPLQLSRSTILARHARAIAQMGAEHEAGTFTYLRRSRHRSFEQLITLPSPLVDTTAKDVRRAQVRADSARRRAQAAGQHVDVGPPIHDDADQFILEMAKVFETRIDEADWRRRSACSGHPTWLWFPAPDDVAAIESARRICETCPVAGDCLEANRDRPDGIFAGLTPDERVQVAA